MMWYMAYLNCDDLRCINFKVICRLQSFSNEMFCSCRISTEKRVVLSLWIAEFFFVKFGCPIHISGMAEARALKFCTKGDYIKSCQRADKSPLKGAWFCSRDPFCTHNCGVRKNYPRHLVNCAINNVADGGLLLIASTALEATLRPKLHRFD